MVNVLLIKNPKSDDPFLQGLAASGHHGECIPALSFEYINISDLAERLGSPHNYAGLVLTSQNSVQACQNAQKACEKDVLSHWLEKTNYVVGEATHLAAHQLLGLDCRGADSGSATALAKQMHLDVKPEATQSFLYPKTSLKTIDLKGQLATLGIQLDELVVYKTLPHPDFAHNLTEYSQSIDGPPDAVVFFSPSGVDYCLEEVDRVWEGRTKLVAVGPSTSQRLSSKGKDDQIVMDKPNVESLLRCLQGSFAIHPS
ncbi:uroporphyrinogen-III synthase-like [Watersipora subatra]|uniref:uroporphyrinogen-III synthase-like n=1 Tax=Watersipora subatra TaxID=2589382 RepID=UPI00355B0E1A